MTDSIHTALAAFDNFESGEEGIRSHILPQPVYMSAHLDIICTRGWFSFSDNGVDHICEAGTFTIILKDSFCKFTGMSDDCRLAVLTSDTYRSHMDARPLQELVLFQHRVRNNPTFRLTEKEMKDVLNIYETIKRISGCQDYPYADEICQLQHTSLFFFLMGKLGKVSTMPYQGQQYNTCRVFMENVSAHFKEERKLEYYAGLQCITPKHLSFHVKKESGISAHQIIVEYVMIEAKRLLTERVLTIAEISDELHFQSQSIFGKYFKKHEGVSPLQFRANIR